jgi:hypothetical protein
MRPLFHAMSTDVEKANEAFWIIFDDVNLLKSIEGGPKTLTDIQILFSRL